MKLIKNVRELKTTISGLFLITISLLNLWVFDKLNADISNVPLEVVGIILGLILILSPDSVFKYLNKKNAE